VAPVLNAAVVSVSGRREVMSFGTG